MYDEFSENYDRFVNWPSRLAYEMPFVEQQLQSLGTATHSIAILDTACGTGMHAIALAERGYRAAGADLSAGMVARARANAAAAGVQVRFEQAGFGELSRAFGRQTFDALLCLGNSLPHALTAQSLDDALSDFLACLRPGGLLLVQNRNFDALLASRERWMDVQSHSQGDDEWVFVRFYDFDPDGLIGFNILTLLRLKEGGWQQQVTSTKLRPLTQGEVFAALAKAGFREVAAFGSLSGETFDLQNSPNLIAVARL